MPISMNDWDVVNAGTFAAVNDGIVSQKKTPSSFNLAPSSLSEAALSGTWDTWRLVPGSSGKSIAIEMPVATGTAQVVRMPPVYATLDATTKGDVDLSTNGQIATAKSGATSVESAFSTAPLTYDKFYFEIRVEADGQTNRRNLVGLTNDLSQKRRFADSPTAYSLQSSGNLFSGGQRGTSPMQGQDASWTNKGDIIGVAVNLKTKKIWFRKGATWLGANADPEKDTGAVFANIDTSQPLYVAVGVEPDSSVAVNLDGNVWSYQSVPMGFTPGLIDRTQSTDSTDLAGVIVSASIEMHQVDGTGTAKNLVADDKGSTTRPAVSINRVTLPGGTVVPGPVSDAFETVLTRQISDFTNVFHIIDAPKQVRSSMAWMKPVLSDYAAADLTDSNGSVTNSVLAILNLTEANTTGNSPSAQVDPRIIANLPKTANAVVAISAERFTEKVLLPAAAAIPEGGKTDLFEIVDDNRVVRNKVPLPFGTIKMNTTDGKDHTVTPKIPKGGLELKIDGNSILVSYKNLTYDLPPGVTTELKVVTFSFDQRLYLKTEKKGTNHILDLTLDDPANPIGDNATGIENFTISTEPKKSASPTAEDGSSHTALIIGCVVGAVVVIAAVATGAWCILSNTVDAADANGVGLNVVANAGVVAGEEIGANGEYIQIDPALFREANAVAAEAGYEAFDAPLNMAVQLTPAEAAGLAAKAAKKGAPPGSMPFKARWALRFSHLLAMADVGDATSLGIDQNNLKKFAGGDLDLLSVEASVEKFIEKVLLPFSWPDTTSWEFDSAELNDALLIYGRIVP